MLSLLIFKHSNLHTLLHLVYIKRVTLLHKMGVYAVGELKQLTLTFVETECVNTWQTFNYRKHINMQNCNCQDNVSYTDPYLVSWIM
jgi:hypothetical protein